MSNASEECPVCVKAIDAPGLDIGAYAGDGWSDWVVWAARNFCKACYMKTCEQYRRVLRQQP